MSPPSQRRHHHPDYKSGRVFGCIHPKVKALENLPTDEHPWRLKPEELRLVRPLFVNLPMHVEHDWQIGNEPVGKWIAVSIDEATGNLMGEGEIDLKNPRGVETMNSIRDGTFKGFSLGVAGYEKFYEAIHQMGINRLDYFEVSVVEKGDIHNSNIVGSAYLTHDDRLVDVQFDRAQIAVGSASSTSYNNSLSSIIQNAGTPTRREMDSTTQQPATAASHTFKRAEPTVPATGGSASPAATTPTTAGGGGGGGDLNSEYIQMSKAEILEMKKQMNELAAMKQQMAEAEARAKAEEEEKRRADRLRTINLMREILSAAGESDKTTPILEQYETEAKAGNVSTETLEQGFVHAVASLKRQREETKNIMAREQELAEENKRLKFEKESQNILTNTVRYGTASSSSSSTEGGAKFPPPTTTTTPHSSVNRTTLAAILSAAESSPLAPAATGAGPLLTHLISPQSSVVTSNVTAPVVATASAASSSSSSSTAPPPPPLGAYKNALSDTKNMWGGNVDALLHVKQRDPRLYELFGEFNGADFKNMRYETAGFHEKITKVDLACLPPGTQVIRSADLGKA